MCRPSGFQPFQVLSADFQYGASRSIKINSTAILLPFGWPFGVPLFDPITIGNFDRLLDECKGLVKRDGNRPTGGGISQVFLMVDQD